MALRQTLKAYGPGWRRDPRDYQLVALSGLFTMAWLSSDFGTRPAVLAAALAGTLLVQAAGTWLTSGRPRASTLEWKSALITAFGLSILLRATDLWIWTAAGAIAIGAKFAIRVRGKHVFNPACIGIVAMLLISGHQAWVSPGQWGQASLLGGYVVALGALTLSSAKRLDIALGFLLAYALIVVGRGLWLGDPPVIALHHLSTGSLLIFAFFMITDPRSTPDRRLGRVLLAISVAALAAWLQFGPNVQAAPLVALALLAPLTPVLDRLLPARRFRWRPVPAAPASGHSSSLKEASS
ncbi:MAG: RnfABCDGE type electron transport complex subunit D [Pseudomonadota bacterium]